MTDERLEAKVYWGSLPFAFYHQDGPQRRIIVDTIYGSLLATVPRCSRATGSTLPPSSRRSACLPFSLGAIALNVPAGWCATTPW